MKYTLAQLRQLASMTAATETAEIDCDEWLGLVGRYVESVRSGRLPPEELAGVVQHVEVCPDCREELEALLRTLDGLAGEAG